MGAGRGVLYMVWGDDIEPTLRRSLESLRQHHPELPVHVHRGEPGSAGLERKTRMGRVTPFTTTLYLDADTVVLGSLDYGFERAEQFGLACCICECPWLRRYAQSARDRTEFNTGVLFFGPAARGVFEAWESLARSLPSASRWTALDNQMRGLDYDDQASFACAVESCQLNPFILPINYNYRPRFNRGFFAPLKIWHAYPDVPPGVQELSRACERGERPVTWVDYLGADQAATPGAVSSAQVFGEAFLARTSGWCRTTATSGAERSLEQEKGTSH